MESDIQPVRDSETDRDKHFGPEHEKLAVDFDINDKIEPGETEYSTLNPHNITENVHLLSHKSTSNLLHGETFSGMLEIGHSDMKEYHGATSEKGLEVPVETENCFMNQSNETRSGIKEQVENKTRSKHIDSDGLNYCNMHVNETRVEHTSENIGKIKNTMINIEQDILTDGKIDSGRELETKTGVLSDSLESASNENAIDVNKSQSFTERLNIKAYCKQVDHETISFGSKESSKFTDIDNIEPAADSNVKNLNLIVKDEIDISDYSNTHTCNKPCVSIGDLDKDDFRFYCCGACTKQFKTICLLHEHLQGDHQMCDGSYYYDNHMRTAFPKYDASCKHTQTDGNEKHDKDSVKQARTTRVTKKRKCNQLDDKAKVKLLNENEKNNDRVDKKAISEASKDCCIEKNLNDQKEPIWKEVKIEAEDNLQNENCNSDGTDDYFDDGDEAETNAIVSKYLKETEFPLFDNKDSGTEDKLDGAEDGKPARKRKQSRPKSLKKLKKAVNVNRKEEPIKSFPTRIYHRKETVKIPANEIAFVPTLVDPIPDSDCKCELCGSVFAFKRGLLRHEQMKHVEDMKFQCQFCEAKFMRDFNLQKHIKCVHTLSKNHVYKERYKEKKKRQKAALDELELLDDRIGKEVGGLDIIKNTIRPYKKRGDDTLSPKMPHTCDICGYTMPRAKMDVHLRIHTGERPFMCHVCGKGLISQNKLKRHMLIHSDVKKHTCDICGVGFQMKYKLRMHQHIHTGKKPYLCSICGAEFNHSSNLATHTRCVHLQIKPFVCTVCGGCYAKRSQLDDHVLSHSSERQFTCRYCGKSFKYFKGMRRHEKNHYEEKSFECDECDCRFTRKDNLDRHKASHLEPSLECMTCKKMFRDAKSLKDHEMIHSDIKRFKCILCGEGYQTLSQYYTHMLAAHNIEKEQARNMHNEEKHGRNLSLNITNGNVPMDPNLPLQLDLDMVPVSTSLKPISDNNVNLSVSQMVSGIIEENRSTINALTRVATENLRLHSEDIRDEEKLNLIVPSVNPLILMDRNNLELHGMESLRLPPGNQSRDEGMNMQHISHEALPLQQDRQSVNMSPMQRISHDNRPFNISPLNASVHMRHHHDNRAVTPISAHVRIQQENHAAVENLNRQHDNHSVPLALITSSENMMLPQGQRQVQESHAGQQNNTIGYRIQNLY